MKLTRTSLLTGIGLVLTGLLAGILAMLFLADGNGPETVTIERAQPQEAGVSRSVSSPSFPDSVEDGVPDEIGRLNNLFKQVARRITPAVTYIRVQTHSGDLPQDWFRRFDDEEARRFFRDQVQSVGSGVIISESGYVVTNHHVVDGAEEVLVTLADKREYRAEVVGSDPSTDIAVLRVDGQDLPSATIGNSNDLEVGEWVVAVGNPFRLTSTVTAGIVSALGRQVDIIRDQLPIENFIQTDAAINPGNSGGALVNMNGELVGISTAIATNDGTSAGYGFAVPSNLMERVVRDLIEYGEVRRGFLGVEIRPINAEVADELGLRHIEGVYLHDVRQGGAADRAGLQPGDVVLAVEERSVNAPNELQSAIAQYRPGDSVTLHVWRGGEQAQYDVELMGKDAQAFQNWFSDAEDPPQDQSVPEEPETPSEDVFELGEWGIGLQALTGRERRRFGVDEGVYLAYVQSGSVAAESGLPRDVVVERIGGQPVESIDDVLQALGQVPGQEPVLWRVKRKDGVTAFYEVSQPER